MLGATDTIGEFKDILSSLKLNKGLVKEFKDIQLEVWTDGHPLSGILEAAQCTVPFIMATMQWQTQETPNGVDRDHSLSSVEGSPLKLKEFRMPSVRGMFGSDSSEQLICPVNSDDARLLVSLYNLHLQTEEPGESPLPLCVMCDGKDPEGLVVMVTEAKPSGKDDAWDIHLYTATMAGRLSADSKMPAPQAILKSFDFGNVTGVEARCMAICDVFNMNQDCGLPAHQGSLKIHLEWRKLTSPLQSIDAVATVKAEVESGDMRSATYSLYTEIRVLQGLLRGLEDSTVYWNSNTDELSVLQRLKLYLEELPMESTGAKPGRDKEEKALEELLLTTRKDLDFTESLWDILKDCQCNEDLVESLHMVLAKLNSQAIQPMIHKQNGTRLATLVRQSYTGTMDAVDLTGLTPLRILAEIGTEKLLRCHTFHLIGKNLVTKAHLEYYLATNCKLEERAHRLEKLHYALELAVMLEQVLHLPTQALSLSTRMALKHFEHHPVKERHTFVIPVQMSSVSDMLQTLHPCEWTARLTADRNNHVEHGVYQLTTRQPFPYAEIEKSTEADKSLLDQPVMYYQTSVSHVIMSL